MSKRLTAFIALPLVLLLTGEALPCGWVLLSPPTKEGLKVDGKLAARLPLSAWTQVTAFDSARECESEKGRWQKEALDQLGKADMDEKQKSELTVEILVFSISQRCVPFDAISDKFPFRPR